jgi:hypothetical protein
MPVEEDTEVNAYVGADAVCLPCGDISGETFFENLWHQTGADVPGEVALFACQCGRKHRIRLCDTEDFAHAAWGEQQRWVEHNVSAEQLRAVQVVLETEQSVSDK